MEIKLTKKSQVLNEIQSLRDLLEGGLTHRNIKEYRTTYVINMQDSLDATHPMLVPFNILSEMTQIISVKVSFWILPFRAYAKAVPSGGGNTSSVTGGNIYTSIITNTEIGEDSHYGEVYNAYLSADGMFRTDKVSMGNNTVYPILHSHYMGDHSHTTPNHTHDLTFGIYEEDNSPAIKFSISKDGGITYGDIIGTYTQDKLNVEISSLVDSVGAKILKFEATDLARLAVQVEIKLDVSR